MRRRHAAMLFTALLGTKPTLASASTWFHGKWRSDPDLSLRNFGTRGVVATAAIQEQWRQYFGKITLEFSETKVHWVDEFPSPADKAEGKYRVSSSTGSTVTLEFLDGSIRRLRSGLTLYRSDPHLFIRSGSDNFEYFRREA